MRTLKRLLKPACTALLILFMLNHSFAQDSKLLISGFSEVNFLTQFGDPADADHLTEYLESGADAEAVEESKHIAISGFNLNLLGILTENLIFQGELFFHFDEDEFEISMLRSYLDYRINPKFKLQVGKFLSPIGYLNRNQRIYGYLNYSSPRDMVNEEFGYIPLSTVGVKTYGTFEVGNSAINYQVAYGASRKMSPHGSELFNVEFGHDESSGPGVSGLLELLTFVGESELIVGISGFNNPKIRSFYAPEGEEIPIGEEAEELEEAGLLVRTEMELSEIGFVPYLRFDASKFQLMLEYHNIKFTDEIGTTPESEYNYSAYTVQLLYKSKLIDKPFYPYVRYDSRDVDEGHPYFGLHNEGDHIKNTHAPVSKEVKVGFAWDLINRSRIKIEYGLVTAGPFLKNNFSVSTSFGF